MNLIALQQTAGFDHQNVIPLAAGRRRDIIVIEDVGISYRCNDAVKDVSLRIKEGGITALIGPSGCGKTSLLLALNRLIDLVAGARVSGSIQVAGREVLGSGVNVRELRKQVGMVFQRPNPFPFSIQRNFELVLDEAGIVCRSTRRRKVEECLRAVGLYDEICGRLDKPATELSGGQQQRLCIARALVTSPKILLLDEPCSALDPISTTTIEKLLLSLKGRMTIVIVTHNLAQARRVADHCALFWAGNGSGGYLLEDGSKEAIFDYPVHETTAAYVSGAVA
jgi:phosphate transport system ATP-binding protein